MLSGVMDVAATAAVWLCDDMLRVAGDWQRLPRKLSRSWIASLLQQQIDQTMEAADGR
jgi:hypothetical protein